MVPVIVHMPMQMVVVMPVPVIVPIKGKRPAGARSEQFAIGGGCRHDGGRAFAADMAVQTDDPIARAHDDMEFMADHQNRAAQIVADAFDLFVERRRPRLIESLCGFVQHQNVRAPQNGTRQ